jgi:hypothetical protein
MLYHNGKHGFRRRGIGDLPPMPANPGGIFGAEYTNNVVDASTRYYEAVRLGQPAAASQALADWTALRQNAGGSAFVPAVGMDVAYANQAANQMYAQQQATPQSSPTANNIPPTTPVSTPTNVVPVQQTTTNAVSPTPETTPTVTANMLQGDSLGVTLSNFLSKLNPLNYVSTLGSNIPADEWISGLPNWATIAIGLGIIAVPMLFKGGDSEFMGYSPRRRR